MGLTASLFILLLYKNIDFPLTPKIEPRKIYSPPLSGEWLVEKYVIFNNNSENKTILEKYLGQAAHFSKDSVFFSKEGCTEPNFKVKLVNSKNYFWDNFKIKIKTIGIEQEYVQVVTINSKERFFDEYIKLDESLLVKAHEGVLLFFKKAEVENDSNAINSKKSVNYTRLVSEKERESRAKSGLLLGLKYKNYEDSQSFNYRTLWISKINNNYMNIAETQDILLPRMNGFWKIVSDKNHLRVTPISEKQKEDMKYIRPVNNASILFAGSDFISIDNNNLLQVLPLDNLLGNPIQLSKTFGKEEDTPSLDSLNEFAANNSHKFNQTNWGVFRRGGRWILRGRTNFNRNHRFKDFDIAYAAPRSLTTYDALYPSFNTIKTKIPEALDAFSSPNRDFVVVLTEKELLVLSIEGNSLGSLKQKFPLNEGESPVMAHWAMGYYVDEWAKKMK